MSGDRSVFDATASQATRDKRQKLGQQVVLAISSVLRNARSYSEDNAVFNPVLDAIQHAIFALFLEDGDVVPDERVHALEVVGSEFGLGVLEGEALAPEMIDGLGLCPLAVAHQHVQVVNLEIGDRVLDERVDALRRVTLARELLEDVLSGGLAAHKSLHRLVRLQKSRAVLFF